ncbi:hypothetical protein GLIP_2274 [Aliiglaciecola lipolytica E3]|uniref:Uncharacterized protein n=1 Tax=Aliiglaciecola lipolytica E3 TaxID=1127673 RepID=K6Y9P6_9ALTE|nr:hypothetical protein GLIP_2274 [Aliiglaciecola lipolytica E3]
MFVSAETFESKLSLAMNLNSHGLNLETWMVTIFLEFTGKPVTVTASRTTEE